MATADVLNLRIGTHIIHHEYMARIVSTRLYDAISRDVLGRWTYPIVPEANVTGCDTLGYSRAPAQLGGAHLYLGREVFLGKNAKIIGPTAVGSYSTIGDNSHVHKCSIGTHCTIQSNSSLNGVYLWDGVQIGPNCSIKASILAEDVCILDGSQIGPGCMLARGVKVGPNAKIPPGTRLCKWTEHARLSQLNLSEDNDAIDKECFLGLESNAMVWKDLEPFDPEQSKALLMGGGIAISCHPITSVKKELLEDDSVSNSTRKSASDNDDTDAYHCSTSSSTSFPSDDDEEDGLDNRDDFALPTKTNTKNAAFMREALDLVEQCVVHNVSVENTALELNSLKFAWNAGFGESRAAVVSILLQSSTTNRLGETSNILSSAKTVWTRWAPLLTRLTHGEGEQVDLLHCISSHESFKSFPPNNPNAGRNNAISGNLGTIFAILYQADAVEEEAIRMWYEGCGDGSQRAQVKPFLDWIDAASSEEDTDLGEDDEK